MVVCIVLYLSYCCEWAGVTKALKRMNRQLNLPQLQKIMMEFERESEIMDLKEETISDTIDDAIGEDDEDEVRVIEGRRRVREGRGRVREGRWTERV